MEKKQYFKLFASCIPVKGAKESIIMDLEREKWYDIPNILLDVLDKNDDTIDNLKIKFKNKYDKGIDTYFQSLVNNELGFFTSNPTMFPDINSDFLSPYKLSTAIIILEKSFNFNLKKVFKEIEELGCQSLQIRIYSTINYSELLESLKVFSNSRLKIIEIYSDYYKDFINSMNEIQLIDSRLFWYLFDNTTLYNNQSIKTPYKINWFKGSLTKLNSEKINKNNFSCNINFFTEAINYNVGLNRKICITSNGDIKNYVNHNHTFGNISNTMLSDVLENDIFSQNGNYHNNTIEKCRDCQYRYMCLSNSDIKIINNKKHKTDDCNFNPYTNEWK